MGHAARGGLVPVGTHVLYGRADDSRTRAVRFLMDPVLPALMLLVIATLTVAIIVLMVTTIAGAILHAQPEVGDIFDPWVGMSASTSVPYEDDLLYPGDALTEDERERIDFWAGSGSYDHFGPGQTAH